MSYTYNEEDKTNYVGFICKDSNNCIEMSVPNLEDHYANGYYFGFKTKKCCYDFMELLGVLRRKLNKANGF
jgi:hypothetical protein